MAVGKALMNQCVYCFFLCSCMAQIQQRLGRSDKRFDNLQVMLRYEKEDPGVAYAALIKLSAHQLYLTEEIVAFSFFSQHSYLANKVKESMAL